MAKRKSSTPTPVGKKIKKVRTQKKMTLDQVANDTGCSIEYLKRLESGQEMPPVGTLLQIARALEIDSGFFLKAQDKIRRKRSQALAKRTDDYAYTTLASGADTKHLKAFRIQIEAQKSHKGVGYQHPGEEFIYVLSGEVSVAVGDHITHLGPAESIHFNASVKHHIKNTGKTDAELLVVLYNP
jgi:transcriptional regulator with XRE-family HTH domain